MVAVSAATTLLCQLANATPALAAGAEHHETGSAGVDQLVVRIVLLTATAVVAGIGGFAPFTRLASTKRLRVPAGVAAGLAVVVGLPGFNRTDLQLFVLFVHLALTVAVPLFLLLNESRLAFMAGVLLTALLGVESAATYEGLARWAGVVHVVGAVVWLGTTVTVAAAPSDVRAQLAKRFLPYAGSAAIAVAGTGILQAQLAGMRFDERLYASAFGRVLLLKAAIVVLLATLAAYLLRRRAAAVGVVKFAAIGLTGALAAGTALAAIPAPTADPGIPLVRQVDLAGEPAPVMVVPHRPGKNLVHIGGPDPTSVAAGLEENALRPANARAGAAGAWVTVDLPAGRSTLLLRRNGRTSRLALDTGRVPPERHRASTALTGPDGPECASAVLGRLLAEPEASTPEPECPSDRLDPADAEAIRGMVRQLAEREVKSVVLLADPSARSRAAQLVARERLTDAGVTVHSSGSRGDALVVLTGWSAAATELTNVGARQDRTSVFPYGIYLAPWLLTDSVVGSAASVLLPLHYNPHAREPSTYAALVREAFPGDEPTASGFRAWLAARPRGPARLYTASQLAFLPKQFQHHDNNQGWLDGGTVVPVSGPLSP